MRNHQSLNVIVIRRAQFKFFSARTHGYFLPAQHLIADIAGILLLPRNAEPEGIRPDHTGLAQRQISVFVEYLKPVKQGFGQFPFKPARRQLIIKLLPGGNSTRLIIGIMRITLCKILLDHDRAEIAVMRHFIIKVM